MIERETGALVLGDGRIDRGVTRRAFKAWPLADAFKWDDMHTGWMQVYLPPQPLSGRKIRVNLSFEGQRLDSYSLVIDDARYGSSWDDWSEKKQLRLRSAHDALLSKWLGPGAREERPWAPKGELTWSFAWGSAWSTYDPRSAASSIVVRFRKK